MNELVKPELLVPAELPASPESSELQEYLGFMLGAEHFALPLRSVREILKLLPVTEVPRTPPEVLGIVSVRGRVTTVIDLGLRLSLEPATQSPHARVLLVDRGDEIVGLLVDKVAQVYRFDTENIEFAVSMGGDTPDHILGIGRPTTQNPRTPDSHDIVVLLNPTHLFRE